MKNREEIMTAEIDHLAVGLAKTFIQRWDMFPQQLDSGAYICKKEPLTPGHISAHLKGEITLGVYLLAPDSRVKFIVIDADDEDEYAQIVRMAETLHRRSIPSYLERSRRGGHLWLFFDEPMLGVDARSFGKGLIANYGLPEAIELYPKQNVLGDGPGSLIRLPFGIHRKDGRRYGFVHPSGKKLAPILRDVIPIFYTPKTVRKSDFDTFRHIGQPPAQTPEFVPTEAVGDTLSERVKAAMSVLDFVGKYVELTQAGKGHCPFHDDRNRSFSINTEKNYWHCFAGCGGGSLIDFWMRYRELDFVTAVRDLAKMLLV